MTIKKTNTKSLERTIHKNYILQNSAKAETLTSVDKEELKGGEVR